MKKNAFTIKKHNKLCGANATSYKMPLFIFGLFSISEMFNYSVDFNLDFNEEMLRIARKLFDVRNNDAAVAF